MNTNVIHIRYTTRIHIHSHGDGDPVDDVSGSDGVSIAGTEVVDEPVVVGDDDDAEKPSPAIHSSRAHRRHTNAG